MTVTMLKGKIHRAVVKQAEVNYVGSITVDPELMEAAGIYEYANEPICRRDDPRLRSFVRAGLKPEIFARHMGYAKLSATS